MLAEIWRVHVVAVLRLIVKFVCCVGLIGPEGKMKGSDGVIYLVSVNVDRVQLFDMHLYRPSVVYSSLD